MRIKPIKFIFLLQVFSIFSLSVMSQSNYRVGYIVKSNGDTLKGFVNYRQWDESPKGIEFKTEINAQKADFFNASSLKGFEVTDFESFISYIGPVSKASVRVGELSNILDTTTRIDTAFLKIVSTGKNVDLLYHEDRVKRRYFIAEKGSAPKELFHYQYIEDRKALSSDPYKRQLLVLFEKYTNSYQDRVKDIMNAKYTEDVLVKYINLINNKVTDKKAGTSTAGFRFVAGSGIAYTTSKFTGPQEIGFGPAMTSTSLSPVISIGLDVMGNADIQKYFFKLDASVYNMEQKFAGSYANFEYKSTIIAIAPQLVVNLYNADKIKFFINVGGGFYFAKHQYNKLVVTQANTIVTPYNKRVPFMPVTQLDDVGGYLNDPYRLRGTWINVQLKTGVVINKKIEIYVATTPNELTANRIYRDVVNTNHTFLLGIKLFV